MKMKMTMTKDEVLALLQDAIDRDRNSVLARVHVGVLAHAKEYLMEQPDVVRCKDCIYHENQGTSFGWIPCMEIMTGDNWFCGSGKRKEK